MNAKKKIHSEAYDLYYFFSQNYEPAPESYFQESKIKRQKPMNPR